MKFPKGPQTPAVLQMVRWISNPMSFMEACAKSYGEIFTLKLDKNLPIGLAFAQLEMKLALAKILSSLELELVDNGEVRLKRRGLVTGPDRPIEMVVTSQRQVKSPILQTSTV